MRPSSKSQVVHSDLGGLLHRTLARQPSRHQGFFFRETKVITTPMSEVCQLIRAPPLLGRVGRVPPVLFPTWVWGSVVSAGAPSPFVLGVA